MAGLEFMSVFKKICKWVLLPLVAIYLILCGIAFTINANLHSEKYAAILIGDNYIVKHNYLVTPIAILGSYPQFNFYFNSKGVRVEYIGHATGKDLERVLKDQKYQTIVIIGEGNYSTWLDSEGNEIAYFDIRDMMKGRGKKQGEWLQLTCGQIEYSTVQLGEYAVERGKAYSFGRPVYPWDIFLATFGFYNLRHAGPPVKGED